MSGRQKAVATFPWQGQGVAMSKNSSRGLFNIYLKMTSHFLASFSRDSNKIEVTKFNWNQNKQNVFMWSHGKQIGIA